MLIRLDKHTCAEFLARWVTDVSVDIITAGCAGSKIKITPYDKTSQKVSTEEYLGIRCWIYPELAEKLDGSQIAKAKGKSVRPLSMDLRCLSAAEGGASLANPCDVTLLGYLPPTIFQSDAWPALDAAIQPWCNDIHPACSASMRFFACTTAAL